MGVGWYGVGLQVARERRLTVGAKLLRLLPLKLSEGGLADRGVLGKSFRLPAVCYGCYHLIPSRPVRSFRESQLLHCGKAERLSHVLV